MASKPLTTLDTKLLTLFFSFPFFCLSLLPWSLSKPFSKLPFPAVLSFSVSYLDRLLEALPLLFSFLSSELGVSLCCLTIDIFADISVEITKILYSSFEKILLFRRELDCLKKLQKHAPISVMVALFFPLLARAVEKT